MPAVTPDTMPDRRPAVALVLLLLHVPPETELPRLVEATSHTDNVPVIAPGEGLTVNITDAIHPVEKE